MAEEIAQNGRLAVRLAKAAMNGLSRLVSARQVARERGVEVDQIAYKPRQEV